MLLNSFFEIKDKLVVDEADKIILRSHIYINKTHTIFEGHFPEQPVVPGVCMIQMTKEILENHLSEKLLLSSASNIKFLSVINPEINYNLKSEITYNISSNLFNVDASLFWEEITFFKIKGSFSAI